MDTFELNKMAAAVLFSLLVVLGVANLADLLYSADPANPMAYIVEGVEVEGEAVAAAAPVEPEISLAALLAEADPAAGEKVARKCVSCHTFDDGGANRIGPNLYGVVGQAKAAVSGFGYSNAMAEHGGSWGFEELYAYLKKPSEYLPGTAMNFAGIRKSRDRANLIAYMNAQGSDLPLPAVEAAAPAAAEEVVETDLPTAPETPTPEITPEDAQP